MWRTHCNISHQTGAKFPNEQAGGGAYVPRRKSTAQETEFATEVLHRVRVTLAECENEMHMSVDFEN